MRSTPRCGRARGSSRIDHRPGPPGRATPARATRSEEPATARFAYYQRLSPAQQRVYRQSDEVSALRLPDAPALWPLVQTLADALRGEERASVEGAAQRLFTGLTRAFATPPCRLVVLSARPHGRWGELQGLYTTGTRTRPARVELWMRTARQRRVVAFRTFLRTLLHELGHHLDYHHLRLADSYHTQGFYQRESSLFHQLLPEPPPPGPTGPA